MAGNFAQISGLIFEAASPKDFQAARQRHTEHDIRGKVRSVMPGRYANAVSAASRKWRNRTASGSAYKNQRVPNDLLSEVAAEVLASVPCAGADLEGGYFKREKSNYVATKELAFGLGGSHEEATRAARAARSVRPQQNP